MIKIRKVLLIFLMSLLIGSATACSAKDTAEMKGTAEAKSSFYQFTDDLGQTVILPAKPQRVVSLMGSYAELWLLAGGELVGVTEDALSERALQLSKDVQMIGTVKEPNLELLFGLSPDFVLLSTDIEAHVKLSETLKQAGIVHAFFKQDTYTEYLHMLDICTDITEQKDRYEEYGQALQDKIEERIASRATVENPPKILLLRALSTTVKALKEDHLVGRMLKDLNTDNIANQHESLLEELSMETIIQEDPDYIFVVTMGAVDKAIKSLEKGLMENPAWSGLTAVQNDRFFILPKELFQYKPNARWDESYEYLQNLLQ